MKHITTIVLFAALATLLGACFALPVEEAALPPPIANMPEPRQMRTAIVERGDLLLFVNQPVTYLPLRQEAMHFNVGQQRIRNIFANVGDTVREGDILAELESPQLLDQLAVARWDEEMLLLQLTQLAQRHNLALDQALASGIPVDDTPYLDSHTRLQGELELVRMRMAHIYRQIEATQIVAPFDGVVVWVMQLSPVMFSSIGSPVITVADQGEYIFRLLGRDAPYIEIGHEYTINIAGQPFRALAVCHEEEGITPPAQLGQAQPEAFFRLVGDSMPLITPAMFATVHIVFDYALDTLMVPNLNVSTVGERVFVHVLEDGVVVVRDIEIGLRGNSMTQVLYGLQEGDVVVIP